MSDAATKNTTDNSQMNAILVTTTGGPDVMAIHTTAKPVPKAGEVLVRIRACGVNFIDVY